MNIITNGIKALGKVGASIALATNLSYATSIGSVPHSMPEFSETETPINHLLQENPHKIYLKHEENIVYRHQGLHEAVATGPKDHKAFTIDKPFEPVAISGIMDYKPKRLIEDVNLYHRHEDTIRDLAKQLDAELARGDYDLGLQYIEASCREALKGSLDSPQ